MNDLTDFHIEKEVLPLFDYTHSPYARQLVLDMLEEPLKSKEEILLRQEILEGFIRSHPVLSSFRYQRIDLLEVFDFFNKYSAQSVGSTLDMSRVFFKKEHEQTKSRFTQTIQLFFKIFDLHISKLNFSLFPDHYRSDLLALSNVLKQFRSDHYNSVIRTRGLKNSDLVILHKVISTLVAENKIITFWNMLFQFEAFLSISLGIAKHHFVFPVMSQSSLSLTNFYHPVLKKPVKNSITLESNVVILTGPNMSGKSTYLKAIGLCILLCHAGVGVPASQAQIPFFDSISAFFNDRDDISKGYSHFMNEVMQMKNVVTEAHKGLRCFVIFDELFKGTNIGDAIDISTTSLKGLLNFKSSLFFVSSHLHELNTIEEVASNQINSYYIECVIENGIPKFTYKSKPGWSEVKIGKILFEQEGLNELLK